MYSSLMRQSASSPLLFLLVCSIMYVSVNAQTTTTETATETTRTTVFPLQECPNLLPCTCYTYDDYLSVECEEVPMEEVRIAFSRISPPIDIDDLHLYIRPSTGDFIPADLLGQSRVRDRLGISGPFPYDVPPLLRVDPNAFRSSSNSLQSIAFSSLDSRLLDFGFLTGFQSLLGLGINDVTDLYRSLPTLPPLPALNVLSFFEEPSLNTALASGELVLQCNGLTEITVYKCDINDIGLAQLLDWVLPSSAKTLVKLYIDGVGIRSMPLQMASFRALQSIYFRYNAEILAIPSNAIYFIGEDTGDNMTAPSISLEAARLNYVGPGAFQGDYRFTQVDLYGNELSRFEETAFKSMLQDMSSTGLGSLNVSPSRNTGGFDCYTDPCHLAWLLRDNRDLLDSLKNARCSDGTPLANLPSSLFENCTKDSIRHQLENTIFKMKKKLRNTINEIQEIFTNE